MRAPFVFYSINSTERNVQKCIRFRIFFFNSFSLATCLYLNKTLYGFGFWAQNILLILLFVTWLFIWKCEFLATNVCIHLCGVVKFVLCSCTPWIVHIIYTLCYRKLTQKKCAFIVHRFHTGNNERSEHFESDKSKLSPDVIVIQKQINIHLCTIAMHKVCVPSLQKWICRSFSRR